jgi:hypothetical protein
MKKFRITIDIGAGTIQPAAVETIEVAPGQLHYRAWDGSLRPIEAEDLHSGGNWIATRWHDDPGNARAEAAAELARRAEQLARLSEACMSGKAVDHA